VSRSAGIRASGVVLALLALGVAARVQTRTAAPATHEVTQADLDRWKKELSNWGRWGKDDQKGTVNLITPAKRRQAARLVKDGVAVSLARDAATEKAIDNAQPYEHAMVAVRDAVSTDRFSISFHGYAHTHLDGLAHHFLDGKMYNGFPRDAYVTQEAGATRGSIHNVKEGIFTRGVLVDLPRLKGVPFLEPGTPIFVEDLEAWERQSGHRIMAGDAVFIRTGRWVRRERLGPWDVSQKAAGLDVSIIPWLRQRDVAILGSESALSVMPNPSTAHITNPDDYLPVHNFVLVALGMPVLDNCQLDAVSEAAAARHRWEFLLTATPLPLVRGTGSPVNPTAIF